MKQCTKCQQFKELDKFAKRASSPDGLRPACKECMAKYDKDRYSKGINRNNKIANKLRKRKVKAFLDRYKRLKGCFNCGEKEPCCLDFHHLDASIKDRSLALMLHLSMGRVKNEARKCIVTCANCHRKIHKGILTVNTGA